MNGGANQQVGDYEILEHLGAGGMGDVYKVEHVISGRIEAMKLIRRELLGNKLAEDRFLREIRVLADLDHPNITRLLTATTINDAVAMIMEFVQGSTIERLLKEGPLSVEETNYYASQMLSALAYAHRRKVVHRDIKPANCMVTIDAGLVKLMDFGLARSSTHRKLSEDGSTSGTFDYMSPEQILGKEVDSRTDLYALGVTMFEMVTGEVLFSHSEGVVAIIEAHKTERPRAPIDVVPSIPPRLNDVILKLLEKKPEDRYQTAEEVLEALNGVSGKITASRAADKVRRTTEIDAMVQQIRRDDPVRRTPTSDLGGGNRVNAQEGRGFTEDIRNQPVVQLPPPPPLRPRVRTAWVGIVLGCVAAAGAAGGGFYVITHDKPHTTEEQGQSDKPKQGDDSKGSNGSKGSGTGGETDSDSRLDSKKAKEAAAAAAEKRRLEDLKRHQIEMAKNHEPIKITPPIGGGNSGNPNGTSGIGPGTGSTVSAVKPPLSPEQEAKLTQLNVQLTTIASGASAVSSRIDSMRRQQAAQGVVMRLDVTEHQTDMNSSISQARRAIEAKDPDEAAIFANKAKDDLDYLKHWAGQS